MAAALVAGVVLLTLPSAPHRSPVVSVDVTLRPTATLAGADAAPAAPGLPWPATGQSAVDIPAIGYVAQSGAEQPVPVASLTKIMTAYVILEDHPISPGRQGPAITVTAADAQDFGTDTLTDQANVEVKAGEVMTEYQMLEGLLVHSANDLAYALACWDAGSVPAFVAKMNGAAAALGMHDTHFADASGYLPASKSTAADILKVAAAAEAVPVFAGIVRMPAVTLPVAGTVDSFTPLLGTPGVVGVKSGFTSAAGGNDVLAYETSVGGQPLTVLAAVTSQGGPTVLTQAAKEALALAQAAASRVRAATVVTAGRIVARVQSGSHVVAARTAAAGTVLYVTGAGATVRQHVHVRPPPLGSPTGTRIGTLTIDLGPQSVSVPVRTSARLG